MKRLVAAVIGGAVLWVGIIPAAHADLFDDIFGTHVQRKTPRSKGGKCWGILIPCYHTPAPRRDLPHGTSAWKPYTGDLKRGSLSQSWKRNISIQRQPIQSQPAQPRTGGGQWASGWCGPVTRC